MVWTRAVTQNANVDGATTYATHRVANVAITHTENTTLEVSGAAAETSATPSNDANESKLLNDASVEDVKEALETRKVFLQYSQACLAVSMWAIEKKRSCEDMAVLAAITRRMAVTMLLQHTMFHADDEEEEHVPSQSSPRGSWNSTTEPAEKTG